VENRDQPHLTSRAVLSHIGWSALRSWGERFTTLAVFIILTRLLAPDQIGALAFLMAIIGVFQVAADGALSEWLVRCAESTRLQQVTIFTLQGLIGIVLALVIAISGLWWAPAAIGRADAAVINAVLTLAIPLGALTKVPEAILRRRFGFKQLAYRSFAVFAAGGAVGIGCALAGFGIWSLVIKQVLETAGALFFTLLAARWRPGIGFAFGRIKEAIRYALAVFGSWIFEAVSLRADSLIVGAILGTSALGFYSIALRIFQVMIELFIAVISRVSISHFAELARRSSDELSAFYVRMYEGSTRLFAPMIAVFAAVAPLIVPLVFGAKWAAAAAPLQALCFIPLCTTAVCLAYPTVLATGKPEYAMHLNIVAAIVTVVGATAGATFGLTGAAIGVASRMLVVTPMAFFLVSRVAKVSVRQHVQSAGPAVLEAGAGLAVALVIGIVVASWPPIARLVVEGIGGIAAAYGVLWLVLGTEARAHMIGTIRRLAGGGA
jgi:O-antigen/teichoic acid export membrane protein